MKETDEIPEYWVEVMQSGYYGFMTGSGEHAWLMMLMGKPNAMLVDYGSSRGIPEPIRYVEMAKELPSDLEEVVTRLLSTYETKPSKGLVQKEVAAVLAAQELSENIKSGVQYKYGFCFTFRRNVRSPRRSGTRLRRRAWSRKLRKHKFLGGT